MEILPFLLQLVNEYTFKLLNFKGLIFTFQTLTPLKSDKNNVKWLKKAGFYTYKAC